MSFQLHLLTDPEDDHGAVCLDGSPAGFYYAAPATTRSTTWVIQLEGGGWCYSAAQCRWRAVHEGTGSSRNWPLSVDLAFGPMSPSPSVNPDFASAHRVHVKYCDGASFAGDAADLPPPLSSASSSPLSALASNVTLRFRGRRILEAAVRALTRSPFSLGPGAEVLLAGCSAGGLAVILGADAVKALLPAPVRRFKALAGSGFFLRHASVHPPAPKAPRGAGRAPPLPPWAPPPAHVFAGQMRQVFALQNLSATVSPACLEEQRGWAEASRARGGDGRRGFDDPGWACVMAQHAARFVEAPIFFLDSAADSWQLGCVLTARPIVNTSAEVDYMGECYSGGDPAHRPPSLLPSLLPQAGSPRAADGGGGGGSLGGDVSSWGACVASYARPLTAGCSADHLAHVRSFGRDFLDDFLGSKVAALPGNGAFITSCVSHCGFSKLDWERAALVRWVAPATLLPGAQGARRRGRSGGSGDGDRGSSGGGGGGSFGREAEAGGRLLRSKGPEMVVMREAVARWWRDGDARGAGEPAHLYLPCELHREWPAQCNPTCPDFASPPASPPSGTAEDLVGGAVAGLTRFAGRPQGRGAPFWLEVATCAAISAAAVALWLVRVWRSSSRGTGGVCSARDR